MGNIINVHNHLINQVPNYRHSMSLGGLSHINFDNYNRMIDWLTCYISAPVQEYNPIYDGNAFGRCGPGWILYKERFDYDTDARYEWSVDIEDDEMAIIFKLEWS